MPRPMPPLPPVTRAALPARLKALRSKVICGDYAILDKSKYLPGGWRMAHVEALREFNRFYTRRIDVLRKDYLGSPFALPEARLVFEIGRTPGIAATTLG